MEILEAQAHEDEGQGQARGRQGHGLSQAGQGIPDGERAGGGIEQRNAEGQERPRTPPPW